MYEINQLCLKWWPWYDLMVYASLSIDLNVEWWGFGRM